MQNFDINLMGVKVGFAICGSFCTINKAIESIKQLLSLGCDVTPIMSFNASSIDTRFGKANQFVDTLQQLCGRSVIKTIVDAEPIGPNKMFDILVVAPCTGNTIAKLAHSIVDTPVTMAVKAHIRNLKPVLLAVSTNDGLAGSSKNIGLLLNSRNCYFVPFNQDDSKNKPNSLMADFSKIPEAIVSAMEGKQIQPIF